MTHRPEIEFARDRLSKLLDICGVSHGRSLVGKGRAVPDRSNPAGESPGTGGLFKGLMRKRGGPLLRQTTKPTVHCRSRNPKKIAAKRAQRFLMFCSFDRTKPRSVCLAYRELVQQLRERLFSCPIGGHHGVI